MLCTHCNKARAGLDSKYATKRLCGRCYWATNIWPIRMKAIREGLDRHGREWNEVRGVQVENETSSKKQPPEPTEHMPGSPEKVRVLQERAAAGYLLYHPLDAGNRREDEE